MSDKQSVKERIQAAHVKQFLCSVLNLVEDEYDTLFANATAQELSETYHMMLSISKARPEASEAVVQVDELKFDKDDLHELTVDVNTREADFDKALEFERKAYEEWEKKNQAAINAAQALAEQQKEADKNPTEETTPPSGPKKSFLQSILETLKGGSKSS